jgi:hypothetical protein
MVAVDVGRDTSVGGTSVVGGGGVAVKTAGVRACGEQEIRRKTNVERRMRDVVCGGMEVILTEEVHNASPIDEKTSRQVPFGDSGRRMFK